MNDNTTPIKSICNNDHTSPVFNHVKPKRNGSELSYFPSKKRKLRIDSKDTEEKPIENINFKNDLNVELGYKTDFSTGNEYENLDDIPNQTVSEQKPNILYISSNKRSSNRNKTHVKNILYHAKNLEFLNESDRKKKKSTPIESQGLQPFSDIENKPYNKVSNENDLDIFMTNTELMTTNDLLQDFATKIIDFSQWTGNTEVMKKSPDLRDKISLSKENMKTKSASNEIYGSFDINSDVKEFYGFNLEKPCIEFKKNIFAEFFKGTQKLVTNNENYLNELGTNMKNNSEVKKNIKLKTICKTESNENNIINKKSNNCIEKNENVVDTNNSGFQSANGKQFLVSNNSLIQAAKLFLDDDSLLTEEIDLKNKKVIEKPNKGKSKSENLIKYTDKLMTTDKKQFKNNSPKSLHFENENNLGFDKILPETKLISDENNLFNNDNKPHSSSENMNILKTDNLLKNSYDLISCSKVITDKSFIGFQMASGKKLSFSQKALVKAKKMFEDDEFEKIEISSNDDNKSHIEPMNIVLKSDNLLNNSHDSNSSDKVNIDKSFIGFQKKSEKKKSFSKEVLVKPEQLFEGDEFNEIEISHKVSLTNESLQSTTKKFTSLINHKFPKSNDKHFDNESRNFQGFATASGKKTLISNEALQKAKNLLEITETDIDFENDKSVALQKCKETILKKNKYSLNEDSTEPENKMMIKNKYITKHLNTCNEESDIYSSNSLKKNTSINFDKKIQLTDFEKFFLSKDNLEKTKCDDTVCDDTQKFKYESIIKESEHFGEISTTSDDIQNGNKSCNLKLVKEDFKGFQTASGKKTFVSNDALNKAKNLLDNEESFSDFKIVCDKEILSKSVQKLENLLDVNLSENFVGFQNTSGKNNLCSLSKENNLSDDEEFTFKVSCEASQSEVIPNEVTPNNVDKEISSTSKVIEFNNCQNNSIPNGNYQKILKENNNNINSNEKSIKNNQIKYCNSLIDDSMNNTNCNVYWKLNNAETNEENELKIPLSPILMRSPFSVKKNLNSPIQSNKIKELVKSKCEENNENELKYDNLTQEIHDSTLALIADEMIVKENSVFEGSVITSPSNFLNDVQKQTKPLFINECLMEVELSKTKFNKSIGLCDIFNETTKTELNNELPQMNNTVSDLKSNVTDDEMFLFDTQILSKMDEREISEEICSMRNLEYEKQKLMIKHIAKRKINCKLLPGSYLKNKISSKNRISWITHTNGLIPQSFDRDTLLYKYCLKKNIINVTIRNVNKFIFSAWDHYSIATCKTNISGIECGDGARLILDQNSNISLERIISGFLTSPGVNSNIVSESWVRNHFKWIILKLVSMERSFPALYANKACTPHNLLLQLKYRYDREIDKVEKSCLKKILQTDDTPSKPMILFCADIYEREGNLAANDKLVNYELELSDGWYSVRTKIDPLMSKVITDGKFAIGDKIYVVGSILLNCSQGCDPLDVSKEVCLQIFSNSSTRARWDARLGFTGLAPMLPCLGTVHCLGGIIHCTEFVVVRRYPMVYLVKYKGKTTMHSEKLELKLCQEFEKKKNEEIEKIYSQVRNCYEQESSKQLKNSVTSEKNVNSIRCPEELYNLMTTSNDPSTFQELLTNSQKYLIRNYCDKKRNSIANEISRRVKNIISNNEELSKRNSSQLLKIRVIPLCRGCKIDHKQSVVLSIWRPNTTISELLNEKKFIRAYNCTAESIRNGDLQISAGRQASFKIIANKKNIGFNSYPFRTYTSITDMQNINFEPSFNEVDTVGIVFYVSSYHNANSFQSVYIADLNKKMIEISFWGGIQHHGYEKLIQVKSVVACSNLQWRNKSNERYIPYVYVTDLTTFSTNPQQLHLKEIFNNINKTVENMVDSFVSECKETLGKLKMTFCTSKKLTPNKKIIPLICDKLGRTSSPPVQKKLDILATIPEPPKLSPIQYKTPTKRFAKPFKPPLLVVNKINDIESDVDSEPLSLE